MALIYLANLHELPQGNGPVRTRTLHFPTGLGLMSGLLSTTDHQIGVVDNYVPSSTLEDAVKELERAQPDYILFSSFLGNHQYGFFKRITRQLKELCPRSIQIIGGPMATSIPDLLLDRTSVDYVVYGEGEETLLELLDVLERGGDIGSVLGIWFRTPEGKAVGTLERPRLKDLTKYPLPLYELFDMDAYTTYLHRTNRSWEISTSRGCYARCSYCKLTFGQKITFRPVEHVIHEMELIRSRWGIDKFNFVDDNFLNSVRQVHEMADGLRNAPHHYRFRFQGRADRIDGNLARILKEVGCFDINYGLESGSQAILDTMDKKLDTRRAEENVKQVLDVGLDVHATFIVGMPNETEETFAETKGYIRRIGLPQVSAGILTPFPATRIYDLAKERGLITDDDAYCESLGAVYEDVYVNLTSLPDQTLRDWKQELNDLAQNRRCLDGLDAAEVLGLTQRTSA